jgi:hypothetical protein
LWHWNFAGLPWRLPACRCPGTTTSLRTTLWRLRSIEWGSAARLPTLHTRCTTRNNRITYSRNTGLWLRYISSSKYRDQISTEKGSKSLDIVLSVCLHLLQVYKYFRYSYIYSPLYLINWDRNYRLFKISLDVWERRMYFENNLIMVKI